MIEKIKIQNYGSFVNFNNDDAKLPKESFIVHGLNGSGKSQICTILEFLKYYDENRNNETSKDEVIDLFLKRKSKETDTNSILINLDNYSIKIDTALHTIFETGTLPKYFIFNENYIERNVNNIINLPEKEIKIGNNNQTRDTLIRTLKDSEKSIRAVNKAILKHVERFKLLAGYTGQARVERFFTVDNYLNTDNQFQHYPEARQELEQLQDPPEEITEHQSINFIKFPYTDNQISVIEEIFSNSYFEPRLTQEFYQKYINLENNFFEKGVEIFKDNNTFCPFCLSPKTITDSKIVEIMQYIDSEYNYSKKKIQVLLKDVISYIEYLKTFITECNNLNTKIDKIYRQLSIDKTAKIITFDETIFNAFLSNINHKIDDMSKTKKDFEIEEAILNQLIGISSDIQHRYEAKKSEILQLNEKISSLRSRKMELGSKIIEDVMCSCYEDANLRDRLNELLNQKTNVEHEISLLPDDTSNNKTIHFFNKIINLLGIHKYELDENSKLILKLEDIYDINNEGFRVSTGERKFIALSYFFAEVLASVDNKRELEDISIFIDDPVDSSDHNKFYSFVSVIENLENILKVIYNQSSIKIGQFGIFTHNALLYERVVNTGNPRFYQIFINSDNQTEMIKPKKKISLVTYSSYIKKVTNYIKNMERGNHNKDIGNYIRRVLEIIASVENIINNKFEGLNRYSKLNALANHLSHESLERMIEPLPNSFEYIEGCIELIELIQERIPHLYITIKEKYLESKEIREYRENYNRLYINR